MLLCIGGYTVNQAFCDLVACFEMAENNYDCLIRLEVTLQDLRHCSTLSSFKAKLKTFLFSQYFHPN